jgi:hypothetical protein
MSLQGPPFLRPPPARIDNDCKDFPELHSGMGRKAMRKANARALIMDQNTNVPRAPAQGNDTTGLIRSCISLSFATVITDTTLNQWEKAAGHARLAQQVQHCNSSGRAKPGHSSAPLGFMDVVVVCEGGADNWGIEEVFRRCHPADIAQVAQ